MAQSRPKRPAAPPLLRGSAFATVDDAGRLKLPAGFRRTIESSQGKSLFVTSLDGDCLLVYPLATWEERERRLLGLSSEHPAVSKFLARVSYYGGEVDIDGQGRILIPANVRASARMEGEVAVLGKLQHLEVWNNAAFRARLEAAPFTEDDHRALAELGL